MARFYGDQAIEFGADICHASGDHHASCTYRTLTTFMDMHDAQCRFSLGSLDIAVGNQGARCGANGPFGVQAHSLPFGHSLDGWAGGERGQVLKKT